MSELAYSLALVTGVLLLAAAGIIFARDRANRKLEIAVCALCAGLNLGNAGIAQTQSAEVANLVRLGSTLFALTFYIVWLCLVLRLSGAGVQTRRFFAAVLGAAALAAFCLCLPESNLVFLPAGDHGYTYVYTAGYGYHAVMGVLCASILLTGLALVRWIRKASLKREITHAALFLPGTVLLLIPAAISLLQGAGHAPPMQVMGFISAVCVLTLMMPFSRLLSPGFRPALLPLQVVSAANLPMLVLDMGNAILFANKAAEDFFSGLVDGRLHGQDFARLMIPDSRPGLFGPGIRAEDEVSARCRSGERCLVSSTVIRDSFDEPLWRVVVIYDMTEHLTLIDDLRAAREEAVAANEAKSYFLANVSHEIRTPMNAIIGITELILREKISPQVRENATSIRQAGNSMLSIVNDILDLSKIESGKMEITSAIYSTVSLITDIVDLVNARLGVKNVRFIVDVDSSLPETLVGDEGRVKQIMLNVLTNAVKFTSEGYIHLTLLCDEGETGEDVVLRMLVRDTGRGIRQEDIGKLFKAFSQLDTRRNSDTEGTGLGLTITEQFVKLMGGSINVESEYGEGSTFVLNIPQKRASALPIAYVENPGNKRVIVYEPDEKYALSYMSNFENLGVNVIVCDNVSRFYDHMLHAKFSYVFVNQAMLPRVEPILDSLNPTASVILMLKRGEQLPPALERKKYKSFSLPMYCLQIASTLNEEDFAEKYGKQSDNTINFIAPGARVLVVDDNQVGLKVAVGLLKPYEMQVMTASGAREAIEAVRRQRPDLVFMDHIMPEMDGVEATRAIRALSGEGYASLPIIALSANAVSGTRELFAEAGLNDFLPKPIDMARLNQILRRWLPQDQQIAAARRVVEVTEDRLMRLGIKSVNVTLGLASIGGDSDGYLEILDVFLSEGRNKVEKLRDLLTRRDIRGVMVEVHALKSSCASIGAYEHSMRARALEEACKQGEWDFVNRSLEDFLYELGLLLDNIRAALDTIEDETRRPGSMDELRARLGSLIDALENLNLSSAEALCAHLDSFIWPGPVARGLREIGTALATFDYDEALQAAAALREKAG
ncbi:MAG: ATP-binding protein [Oscillospiraceae bacterium]|nr:ATP-binding protein [Oscillospiraceae bacterium]